MRLSGDDDPCPRAAASMEAFDAMPEAFRRYCSEYPRTTQGQNLLTIFRRAEGRVHVAAAILRELLPVDEF